MSDRINKNDVELALWRSGLIKEGARPMHVESAAKDIARASNTLRRISVEKCNGVPHWNQRLQLIESRLDESDVERHEKQESTARADLERAARDVLRRGLVFKFYTDPRAGVACRISNRANTKDCFV